MVAAVACVSDDDLRRLAAGELDDATAATIHEHLDECPSCAAALLAAVRGRTATGDGDTAPTPRVDEADAARTMTAAEWARAHSPAAALTTLPRGTRLGRYEVRDELGSGNMGTVFAGWDPQLARPVAIKVLRAGRDAPDHARRLVREAKAMAQVRHRNVVTVFEVGQDDDVIFIAMERIEGETLRVAMQRRPPTAVVLGWLAQAAAGLAAVHRAGLMHRDIKPDNIFVEPGADAPRVVIGDFGLAIGEGSVVSGLRMSSVALATRGAGTPAYMAPEQLEALPLDSRADVFAFGVAAWELLTGRRPFEGKTAAALHDAILRGPVTRLRAPGLPRSTARLLEQCVQADRTTRPASMLEVAAGLAPTPRRRWLAPVLAAAAVAGIAPVAYVAVQRGQRLERVGTVVPCDPAAPVRWQSDRAPWVAAAATLAPSTRAQILQAMDARTDRWRAAAAAGCTGNVLARQAFASCRARVEAREHAVLTALPGAAWPDDARALELVLGLEAPGDCVGRQAAEDGLLLATLSDAARAAVATGRAELDRARVAAARGDRAAARAALTQAAAAATAARPSPLDGELALVQLELDPPATPAERQRAARALAADAERGGVTGLVARAWLEVAAQLQAAATDPTELDEALTRAEWAITRLGDPPTLRVRWLLAKAWAARVQGQRTAAASSLDAALAIVGRDAAARPMQAAVLTEQATLLGDDRALITRYQAQLAGPALAAPDAVGLRGLVQLRLAEAHHRLGELAAAQAVLDQVVALDAGDPTLAPLRLSAMVVAASVATDRGATSVAQALLATALTDARALFGPTSTAVADVQTRQATLWLAADAPADAIPALRAAIATYRERVGARSQPLVIARGMLSEALLDVGQAADALAEVEPALADAELAFGAEHPLAVQLRLPYAAALAARGRTDDAIAALDRALAVFGRHPFAPDTVANAEFQLASLLYPRDPVRAAALARAADGRLAAAGWDAARRAELTAWIAGHPAPR